MKTSSEVILQLREPLQPAHGAWAIYGLTLQALATLIEQNEKIIELLGPTEKK
jgi:hypothetical protein